MSTIGKFSAAGLQSVFTSQRQQLLDDARAGKDVTAQLSELGSTIGEEFKRDDFIAQSLSAEMGIMRSEGGGVSASSRESYNAAYGEASADYKISTHFNSLATAIGLVQQGPGDGSKPGQKALYELATNPNVSGIRAPGGYLEVTLSNPAAKADVTAWFDKNAGDLKAGYKLMAFMTQDQLV